MEMYILKSAACLAILMVVYKFLLEKESMHVFKRCYLLGAVLISFFIPWVTFTTYIEPIPGESALIFQPEKASVTSAVENTSDLSYLLWSLYGIGVLFFGIKFILNLKIILLRIKRNPKIRSGQTTNVLLQEKLAPHTFWSYIFLNKRKFEEKEIPQEVFQHEQAHADQRHSADILIMELLQIIFWFHPVLYMAKKAIRLNHEFLADRAVLNRGIHTAAYQKTLLAFSSNAFDSSLVNLINYPSIKKRFTVMKTNTSKKIIWAKSLVLLPLLAVLVYGFSSRELIPKETRNLQTPPLEESRFRFDEETDSVTVKISKVITIKIRKDGSLLLNKNSATLGSLALDIEKKQRDDSQISRAYIETFPEASQEIITKVKKIITESGIPEIYLGTKGGKVYSKTWGNETSKGSGKIDQEKATPEMIREYNRIAKKLIEYNKKSNYGQSHPKDISPIRLKDVERMKYIYSIMSEEQKQEAEPLPGYYPPPPPPPPITKDAGNPAPPLQTNIYDLAAEGVTFYYKGKTIEVEKARDLVEVQKSAIIELPIRGGEEKPRVKITDKKELTGTTSSPSISIYNLAAEGAIFYYKGKAIEVEKARDLVEVQKSAYIELPIRVGEKLRVKIIDRKETTGDSNPPPPPPPPAPTVNKAGGTPPPPPPPPSPIEAVEGWIEEGATFFYNGNSISGKEAVEIVQKNNGKNLSVKVEENNSQKTVRLSDKKQ